MLTPLLAAAFHLIPGSWPSGSGPDGNTVLLEAPAGLIVVDTGRHPEHQDAILAAVSARGKPIAAIVNTHWHLDHTGGNAELRAVFPGASIIASNAVDGALAGFLRRSRAAAEGHLRSGRVPAAQAEEIRRDMAAMDDLPNLRPTRIVARAGPMMIAGRSFDVHLERFAATAGDVWLYLPGERVAIVGDLVVGPVPFMDTACPAGWRRALANIAKVPFRTLIPGHGGPMDRAGFQRWRTAFGKLLDCGAGPAARQTCIDGWMRDAARFISEGDRVRVPAMIGYYIDTRLRAPPAERARYCVGGTG